MYIKTMIPIAVAFALLAVPCTASAGPLADQLCASAAEGLVDMRWDRHGALPQSRVDRLERCASLASSALEEGLGLEGAARVVAIAYNESNFRRGVVGQLGELGMMQVRPKLHCHRAMEHGVCDPDLAGIRFLLDTWQIESISFGVLRHRPNSGFWQKVLQRYNGSWAYGVKVDMWARGILRRFKRA